MIRLLIMIAISSISSSCYAIDICDLLNLENCSGVTKQGRRTSLQSLPSPATSAMLNPATTSFDRGVGVELIHQNGNNLVWNLASGTGKLGGALISSSLENSFFGNRVKELDNDYLERNLKKKQYETKKHSLALGGKLFRKKHVSLDVGLMLKRHTKIGRINPGVGASGQLGPFRLGAAHYQDDFFLRGNSFDGTENYSERFMVSTYSIGTKISNFAFDIGAIKTKYKRDEKDSDIFIYSGSYIYKNLMINLAHRSEKSPAPKFIDDRLEYEDETSNIFAGVQASLGKHLILGVNYNYFLLQEISFLATISL